MQLNQNKFCGKVVEVIACFRIYEVDQEALYVCGWRMYLRSGDMDEFHFPILPDYYYILKQLKGGKAIPLAKLLYL
jgi:hypothetical protein